MNLDVAFWKSLIIALGLASSTIVLLSAAAALLGHRPAWKKHVWQSCLFGLFALYLVEISGTGGGPH